MWFVSSDGCVSDEIEKVYFRKQCEYNQVKPVIWEFQTGEVKEFFYNQFLLLFRNETLRSGLDCQVYTNMHIYISKQNTCS